MSAWDVQTYVAWNMHEPYPGDFRWDGWQDVEGFLELAQKVGLMVVLRPGPYICAEWDFGGFPWWLGSKQVRHASPRVIKERDSPCAAAEMLWQSSHLCDVPLMHHRKAVHRCILSCFLGVMPYDPSCAYDRTGAQNDSVPESRAKCNLIFTWRCRSCLQVLGGGTMKIRTNDAAYLTHVDRWWSELLPRMTRLLYSNGGPIVLIQVLSLALAQMERFPVAFPKALRTCG